MADVESTATAEHASARRFVEFLKNAGGSPNTATAALRGLLLAAAFVEIKEDEPWQLVPGGKYFFTRHHSAIVAFCIGSQYVAPTAQTDTQRERLAPQRQRDVTSVASRAGGGPRIHDGRSA